MLRWFGYPEMVVNMFAHLVRIGYLYSVNNKLIVN